ncbi:MAG: glucose dehydrogenase, partial [Candidatus Marinimicrobia bacterium]|nr:glucose dehydrogenase [Candidatus Neomarinimicrobiota bacterium]
MKKILIAILPFLLQAEELSLSSTLIADGFSKPLFVTSDPTNSRFLYVVEQAGKIVIIKNDEKLNEPFLDISDRVVNPGRPGDERGLLGFAFHPDYESNNKFYVNYINNDGFTIVSEFSAQSSLVANTLSERVIFDLKQPYGNHNGGHMQFGPDGYLYISIGDGGKRGDPLNAGQDLNTLFGKVIRIDVNKTPYGIPKSNPYYGQKDKR